MLAGVTCDDYNIPQLSVTLMSSLIICQAVLLLQV